MTEVDLETWLEIQRELREGTPNTPERIALFKRADEIYARTMCPCCRELTVAQRRLRHRLD